MNAAERLRDGERDWFRRLLLKRREIEQHEFSMGDALASGGDLGEISKKLSTLQNEAKTIERALGSIREQRVTAIAAETQEQGKILRRQAQQKLSERAALVSKTEKFLKSLSELQGIEYTPGILAAQRRGGWTNLVNSRYEVNDLDPFELMHASTNQPPFQKPKTRQLADEAIHLEDQAASIEQSRAAVSGGCEGDTVETLIAAAFRDPMRLCPAAETITTWARAREDEFRAQAPVRPITGRRFSLRWNDNLTIDSHSSFAEFITEPQGVAA